MRGDYDADWNGTGFQTDRALMIPLREQYPIRRQLLEGRQ